MKERPILFSAPMVRAILEGRKTQTRRIVKWPVLSKSTGAMRRVFNVRDVADVQERLVNRKKWKHPCDQVYSPYGVPADRLWVRETWYYDMPPHTLPKTKSGDFDPDSLYFRADGECCQQIAECSCAEVGKPKWRPGMFLPRWASRLTLLIKAVRVERLQHITEADAIAEGCIESRDRVGNSIHWTGPVGAYMSLWESINGPGSWAANPWVWVVEFERKETP